MLQSTCLVGRVSVLTLLHKINQATNKPAPQEYLNNLILCTYIGSHLNGTATEDSDIDLVGIYVPPKRDVFPTDFIVGYDYPKEYKNYQCQEVFVEGKKYDIKYFSLLNFMKLAETGSPNQLEPIFAPQNKVLYSDAFGYSLRATKRHLVTKVSIPKFIGTAASHWKYYQRDNEIKQASEAIRLLVECEDFINGEYKTKTHTILADIKNGALSKEAIFSTYWNLIDRVKLLEQKFEAPWNIDTNMTRLILKDILQNFYWSGRGN
jgi:predicted nucleotidyltransferase